MKTEKEIYLERLTGLAPPGPDTDQDSRLVSSALAENRALATLAQSGPPPPDRDATFKAALREPENDTDMEQTMGNPIISLLRGRRWYLQAAIIILLITLISTAVFIRPTVQRDETGQVVLSPLPPAWAAQPGYLLSRNLGDLSPADISAIDELVVHILSEELGTAATSLAAPAHELVDGDAGYRLRLALPSVEPAELERVQGKLSGMLTEELGLPLTETGEVDSVMLLYTPFTEPSPGRPTEWLPASRIPGIDELAAKLRTIFKHTEGDRHIRIDLDIIDGQITMRFSGDDELEAIGPCGTINGRDVMWLREAYDGEQAMAYTTGGGTGYRVFNLDDSAYVAGVGNYSYSYTMNTEDSDYESVVYSIAGTTDASAGVSGWVTPTTEDSAGGYSVSAGTSSGGASSAAESATASAGTSSQAAGTTPTAISSTTSSSAAGSTLGSETEGEVPYVSYAGSEVYREHYRLLNKYITDTYNGGPVSMKARGTDGVLSVEIEVDGVKDVFTIEAGESGEINIIHTE